MTEKTDKSTTEIIKAASGVVTDQQTPLVVRSKVQPETDYQRYREPLRFDFYYSCAYCTMSEAEAAGIGFEIDHYTPQSAAGAVVDYSNLMYSCRICNRRKTSMVIPPAAQADGYKIFRADEEIFDDHFELQYSKLKEKTKIGKITIAAADLNRDALKKLRGIRERLYASHDLVTKGLRALAGVRIDQLPSRYRPGAKRAIADATEVGVDLTHTIDSILRDKLKSPLIDPDAETASRLEARRGELADLRALYPGTWLGGTTTPKAKPQKKSSKAKR